MNDYIVIMNLITIGISISICLILIVIVGVFLDSNEEKESKVIIDVLDKQLYRLLIYIHHRSIQ